MLNDELMKRDRGIVTGEGSTQSEESLTFKVYPYRFVNTGIYILGMLQISIMQNSFAPQAAELTVVYDQSTLVYNLTSLIHMIVHVPVSFPANYIVDKYGTKVGNTIACVFCLCACWVRCLINQSFMFAILGQFFVGCANPFMINAISKVPSNWYQEKQRASVTGFLSFFSTVTGVVGLLIPGLYFSGYTAKGDTSPNYEDGKNKMFHLLVLSAVMVSVASILNLFFYRDKPATPPSFAANIEREDFKTSLKELIRNPTYILISVVFSLVYGCFIDFAVVLGQLIHPYGFESSSTSALSACCVVSGIVGSVVILTRLKKANEYKKLVGGCILGSLCSVVLFILLLSTEQFFLVVIAALSLGFFIIPVVPVLLELANEVCFPIGEATVTGFIYTLAHISSFVLGTIFSVIIDAAPSDNEKQGTIRVVIMLMGVFAFSFGLVFLMKENLKRTKAEEEQKRLNANGEERQKFNRNHSLESSHSD